MTTELGLKPIPWFGNQIKWEKNLQMKNRWNEWLKQRHRFSSLGWREREKIEDRERGREKNWKKKRKKMMKSVGSFEINMHDILIMFNWTLIFLSISFFLFLSFFLCSSSNRLLTPFLMMDSSILFFKNFFSLSLILSSFFPSFLPLFSMIFLLLFFMFTDAFKSIPSSSSECDFFHARSRWWRREKCREVKEKKREKKWKRKVDEKKTF